MKIIKKLLKALLIVILIVMTGFISFIVYAVIKDYRPKPREIVFLSQRPDRLKDSLKISFLTWNIGYCGLDREMDFFYDGGTKVFTPKEKCYENLAGIKKFIHQNDSMDFIFLQEVDKGSKRSNYLNEYDTISSCLKSFTGFFGDNYDVFFVPVPLATPMGKVLSGITLFSKFIPSISVRYAFPGKYGFPKQLFMLDRCFLVNRYPLKNGKELIAINTHNEAFDPGEIRKKQMAFLRDYLLNEYNNGNYVVAGGDWNQCPPDFRPAFKSNKVNTEQMIIPSDYLPPDWKWLFDDKTPSNRSVVTAYDPETTPTTVIDFFILSPNIEALSVKCIDLNFEYSDHNPVIIEVRIK